MKKMHEFGKRLRILMKDKGITQEDIAKKLAVTRQCVSTWVIGKTEPNLSTVCEISDYFGVSVDYMLGLSDEERMKEMKVVIDGKEYIEKDSIKNWLFEYNESEELRDFFENVERALGFKLFRWQKSFIITGRFRRFGATTAECLRILLAVDAEPIDYSMPAKSAKEDIFRRELKCIKEKLDAAGIETRDVYWNEKDKQNHFHSDVVKIERRCLI